MYCRLIRLGLNLVEIILFLPIREVERLRTEVASLRREVEEKGARLRTRDEELALQDSRGGGRGYEKQMEMLHEEQTNSRGTIHR